MRSRWTRPASSNGCSSASSRGPAAGVATAARSGVAAAIALLAAGIALQPDARRAVARWLGLDGVLVVVDRGLEEGPAPTSFDLPGPGESRVLEVDGRQILVSTLRGTWDGELLRKTVGTSAQIEEVEVDGNRGLWISGAPHEVFYESSDGRVAIERVAADTLLWQDDGVLWRVEGFDRLADALAFAEQT